MSLLPENANFLEHVQAYFLTFRGDGVALSPLDADLLAEWHSRGTPYHVICQGIRKTAESLIYQQQAGARIRTLRSCRKAVERELCRWEGTSTSTITAKSTSDATQPAEQPQTFAAKRLKKARNLLNKALKTAPTQAHRLSIARALSVLEPETQDPRQVSLLISRAEETFALTYVRNQSFTTRRAMLGEIRSLVGSRQTASSARAHKDALRAHLVALAFTKGNLLSIA